MAELEAEAAAQQHEAATAADEDDDDDSDAQPPSGPAPLPSHKIPADKDGTPKPKAQRNFTDGDSRIMKTGDGFIQGYNCQAAVDEAHQIIVAQAVTNQPPDVEHLIPMIDRSRLQLRRRATEPERRQRAISRSRMSSVPSSVASTHTSPPDAASTASRHRRCADDRDLTAEAIDGTQAWRRRGAAATRSASSACAAPRIAAVLIPLPHYLPTISPSGAPLSERPCA